jgi:hypothetical protein
MKRFIILVIVLFTAIGVYVVHLPPKEMTLKDLHPSVTVHAKPEGAEELDTAHMDSAIAVVAGKSDKDTDKIPPDDETVKPGVEFYIIIESLRDQTVAQLKAEKLRKEFTTNIIVLPPTKEGNFRISYGKYSSLEEAKSMLKNARTNISRDAWIYSMTK